MPDAPPDLPFDLQSGPLPPKQARWVSWLKDAALTLGFGALIFFGLSWLRAPSLPEVAPPFALRSLTGEVTALDALRGQPVVVNFWATWCGPCRVELPTLTRFARLHPEVPVLFVAVDGRQEDLRAFAEAHGMPLNQVLRIDPATAAAYGVGTLPTTVVVTPEGRVGSVHAGVLLPGQLSWMTGRWWPLG